MYKALRTIAWMVGCFVSVIIICIIGIPSRLFSKSIDIDVVRHIQAVNLILIKAQRQVSRGSVHIAELPDLLPDAYGYITSAEQVDKLFAFLTPADRMAIKSLFRSGDIQKIHMNSLGCISYTVKVSLSNDLTNSSWETLYLVYSSGKYSCEGMNLKSTDRVTKERIQHGWIKLDVISIRQPIQC